LNFRVLPESSFSTGSSWATVLVVALEFLDLGLKLGYFGVFGCEMSGELFVSRGEIGKHLAVGCRGCGQICKGVSCFIYK
jgi:hypothetical protein